jgi:hypothetical protein
VYADDQDKKTVCCFWIALGIIVIMIGALASYAGTFTSIQSPKYMLKIIKHKY